jgi:bifunctional DNA-binding transcriptional regulator/antitoxin component of YhaV-PrlF toxin-antitoxin module
LRKEFGIKPGDKLIVLAGEHGDFQSTVLMKSEAVTKMLEHFMEMGKMLQEGSRGLEGLQKEGLRKMQEFGESGFGALEKHSKKKKK